MLANSVDHGQMPRSPASDLGLHCLHMLKLNLDARHKWLVLYYHLCFSFENLSKGGLVYFLAASCAFILYVAWCVCSSSRYQIRVHITS